MRAQKDGKNCFLLTLACINISGRRLGWGRQGGEGGRVNVEAWNGLMGDDGFDKGRRKKWGG